MKSKNGRASLAKFGMVLAFGGLNLITLGCGGSAGNTPKTTATQAHETAGHSGNAAEASHEEGGDHAAHSMNDAHSDHSAEGSGHH